MNHLIRHYLRLLLVALFVVLAVLPASTSGIGSARTQQADQPVYGGAMHTAFSEDFVTFDPAEASGVDSTTMYGTLFDELYQLDRNMQPVLDLADGQPVISADAKTWTFKIRKGILFSNGTELTADDVKYSIMRVLDPHLKPIAPAQGTDDVFVGSHDFLTGKATDVSGIQVVDKYTIRFQLTQPLAVLPFILAQSFNGVVPKALVSTETQQQIATNPVGTGPFTLQSWQKGVQAIFVKNPHYFRTGQPYLDKVVVSLNVSPSVIALKVQSGALDAFAAAFEIAAADLQQMRSDPKYASYISEVPGAIAIWLELNVHDPVISQLPIRQAIAMAINRKKLVKLDGGAATVASQFYLPTYPQYDKSLDLHPVYPYDPAKAAALVKSSGYHGQSIVLLSRTGVPYFQAIVPGIQQDLQQIGLNTTIKEVGRLPYHVVREQLTGHQLNPMDWGIDYADAWDTFTWTMACSGSGDGGFSGSHFCDPQADVLANKAQALPLGPARDALFKQVQIRILQSATKIPLIFPKNTEIASPKIGGFYYQPNYGLLYGSLWLKP